MDQHSIIQQLGVTATFDAATEVERRTTFLVNYLRTSGAVAYVLGISGGVDSLTAGLLAQRAVSSAREAGRDAGFIAVLRIPMKPAIDSETKPATCSDFIPAGIPI